jgi:hypothetical protein
MTGQLQNTASREQYARVVSGLWNDLQQATVETALQIGRTLQEARDALDHGEWGMLFSRREIPFSQRTANCFISIAQCDRISNSHLGANLPNTWRTLYELSRLTEAQWDYLIERDALRADMGRGDIQRALRGEPLEEEDDAAGGSEFYGLQRINRLHEAWDTIDPRLVPVLIQTVPSLLRRSIWEPAAGDGHMVEQLRSAGCIVAATTDIAPREATIDVQDFFAVPMLPGHVDAIVTNPPWGDHLAPFVRHAVEIAEPAGAFVAMLVPLPWIAGASVKDLTGHVGFDSLIVPRFRARWMTEEEEAALGEKRRAKGKQTTTSPKMNHVWAVWDFSRKLNRFASIVFADAKDEDARLTGIRSPVVGALAVALFAVVGWLVDLVDTIEPAFS